MLIGNRFFRSSLLAAALLSPVGITDCAAHVGVGYRVYDPGYRDYHVWSDHEGVYYRQWAIETRRDNRRDFRKLKPDEQREYWNWRHDHPNDRH
jgi:hypothetical protein